jgi:hypothetical protein
MATKDENIVFAEMFVCLMVIERQCDRYFISQREHANVITSNI